MAFEQQMRDRLRHVASAVEVPGGDPAGAVRRGRSLRRRRRVLATSAGAVLAAALLATPVVVDDSPDSTALSAPGDSGLVPTGPLDLRWTAADGGLQPDERGTFQADDGTVYALSTGPGVRLDDHDDEPLPRALYRLADDGTWQPLALDGQRPRAVDASSTGDLLYAVSTGPAGGGDQVVARLSTSADGGETWATDEVPPVDPPSTAAPWLSSSTVAVESSGSTTLALVTTTHTPDYDALFPELAGSSPSPDLSVEDRDAGPTLLRQRPADGPATTTTTATTGEPAGEAAGTTAAPAPSGDGEPEVVRTIPWSELGVDGPGAMAPRHQLFRYGGDGWEQVPGAGDAIGSLDGVELGVAGDRFVLTGWQQTQEGQTLLTSPDGASWSAASVPHDHGRIIGVGSALVALPGEGTTLGVSGDAGRSWSELDLVGAGVDPGSVILAADGGALGLALVVDSPDGGDQQLVVSGDLIDWTVTPVDEIVGADDTADVVPFVGDDRLVLTAVRASTGSGEPPASVTAVGTPARTG